MRLQPGDLSAVIAAQLQVQAIAIHQLPLESVAWVAQIVAS